MSRACLVQTYIDGLSLTSITVIGAGKQCRIITGEPPRGEPIAARYYLKASHAEMVIATIGRDGLQGKPAAALVDAIKQAAAMLGARFQTLDEVRKAAGSRVDEIVERVKSAGLEGKLKRWNAGYRQYRLEAVAKAEKAMPYASYIELVVTMPTVRIAAGAG
jgi:hypothetical protein